MGSGSYRRAGVDIDAAGSLVEKIKPLARATLRPGVVGGIGGFSAVFDPRAAGFRDPLLLSTTDGVGTKLKVAFATGRHDDIGIDLVAMCVNDLVVQGATPLFFLDYFATGKLDVGVAETVIAGIARGCQEAACALVGGETAEMPGMYGNGEYDLAGFAVGAVDRERLIDGKRVAAGDVILGLPSSGTHSNGYSLIRRIVADAGLDYAAPAPFAPGRSLGEALLTPTRIYVRAALAACATGHVRAMAHITGGGFPENLPRVYPETLAAQIEIGSWAPPPIFGWLAATGKVPPADMATTFNCGIGLVVIAEAAQAGAVESALRDAGEAPLRIGRMVPRAPGEVGVVLSGLPAAWPR
ncbi:MAG: phosphoribosylformylglycinamidine cyclo-ligase [Alphaproteobacteria bacterium]|nr:phosphoribosylformylglycinamidine cyclo-ligase [Alphaproteobacteria bacterium]